MEVRLPQWGMEMTEGTIAMWFKAVGEHVDEGDVLAEVETGKVVGELEAPASGTLVELLVPVGGTAQIFDVVAAIEEDEH